MWWLIVFLAVADGKPAKVEITGPYTEGECLTEYRALPIPARDALCYRDWKPMASAEQAWEARNLGREVAP